MKELDKKIANIKCFDDFEKIFYPKAYKEKLKKAIDDPGIIATKLANKSLREVKHIIFEE